MLQESLINSSGSVQISNGTITSFVRGSISETRPNVDTALATALKNTAAIVAGLAFSLTSNGVFNNSVNFSRSISSTNVARLKDEDDMSNDVLIFSRTLNFLRNLDVSDDAEYSQGFDAIYGISEPLIENGRLDRIANLIAVLNSMNVDSYFEAAVYRSASDYRSYIPHWSALLARSVERVSDSSMRKDCFGGLLELRG